MPIVPTPPATAPSSMSPPGSVSLGIRLHSSGVSGTSGRIRYRLGPGHNMFFRLSTGELVKTIIGATFAVPLTPGINQIATLELVRGAGSPVSLLPILMDIQEVIGGSVAVGTRHVGVMITLV